MKEDRVDALQKLFSPEEVQLIIDGLTMHQDALIDLVQTSPLSMGKTLLRLVSSLRTEFIVAKFMGDGPTPVNYLKEID